MADFIDLTQEEEPVTKKIKTEEVIDLTGPDQISAAASTSASINLDEILCYGAFQCTLTNYDQVGRMN